MAEAILESAIPAHLQVPRTCPARMPTDYKPPFPAYCARFSPSIKEIVMAIFGAQHADPSSANASSALTKMLSFVNKDDIDSRPKHHDLASVTDTSGAYNECVIAYWNDSASFEKWKTSSGFSAWWDTLDPEKESHGWFQEVFLPSMDRAETVYSDFQPGMGPEGHGTMSEKVSGQVQEHVYWGSMRDRLPASQTDELVGETPSAGTMGKDTKRSRVKVHGKKNLCVIRSGQDWSMTVPEERKLYLETMHPVLIEGMNFLRDHGDEIGCYSSRFMDVLEQKSPCTENKTDQTFGLAYFDDIANLEKWSKEHKTHLNIFGGFLQYVKKLNYEVTLHLYHEVLVLKPEQQQFEYIGCHPRSGMLKGLQAKA